MNLKNAITEAKNRITIFGGQQIFGFEVTTWDSQGLEFFNKSEVEFFQNSEKN